MALPKAFVGTRHAHGCIRCHVRYEDACLTPEVDELCMGCRGGRPHQVIIENSRPVACCKDHSRLINKDDRSIYKLAGSHPWWICRTCARTNPYDPRTWEPDRTD